MESQTHENQPAEHPSEEQSNLDIPTITIDDPDRNPITRPPCTSSTETAMSSSHPSSHHSSSSSSKGRHHSSSKSKSTKDDWSEITDPEARRRVQNRIAQRKFRDKAKEAKERQDRDAENRTHAGHSYHTPDPHDIPDEELSGLPWGSLSLRHVVSKGKAKEEDSRRGGSGERSYEERSYYDGQEPVYDERDVYYEDVSESAGAYYDYGSGSGAGSR